MRNLVWGKTFVRAFRRVVKKHPELKGDLESTLRALAADPFDARLASHKLKGKLAGSWACTAAYDLRILFEFVESEGGTEKDIFLQEIGTHDEVY